MTTVSRILKKVLPYLLWGGIAAGSVAVHARPVQAQSSLSIDSSVIQYFATPGPRDAQGAELERVVCLIGTHYMQRTTVDSFVPAITDPAMTTGLRVVQVRSCADQGLKNVVGIMHSHPTGTGCFYYFPLTSVGTSDLVSAMLSPYDMDAIYCRGKIVWLDKEPSEHQQ